MVNKACSVRSNSPANSDLALIPTTAFGQTGGPIFGYDRNKPNGADETGRTLSDAELSSLRERDQEAIDLAYKGLKLLDKNDVEGAIKFFKACLSQQEDPNAYAGLAEAYARQGCVMDSIRAYRRLLYEYDDKHWGGTENNFKHLLGFAVVLNEAGLWEEALASYNKGVFYLKRSVNDLAPLPFDKPFRKELPKKSV